MAGSAIPTTVASIDATADPSTVASRTHRPGALAYRSPAAFSTTAMAQCTTRTVLPGGRGCPPPSYARRPSASGKVRPTTGRRWPPRVCARSAIIVSTVDLLLPPLPWPGPALPAGPRQALLVQPVQAPVGDLAPAAVDGQAVAAVGEFEQAGDRRGTPARRCRCPPRPGSAARSSPPRLRTVAGRVRVLGGVDGDRRHAPVLAEQLLGDHAAERVADEDRRLGRASMTRRWPYRVRCRPGTGPGSSWPAACGCAGTGGSPNPATRCAPPARRSPRSGPRPGRYAPTGSWPPPERTPRPTPVGTRAPGGPGSPHRNCRSPNPPPRVCPTAPSGNGCTCPTARSARTSTGSTRNSASPHAANCTARCPTCRAETGGPGLPHSVPAFSGARPAGRPPAVTTPTVLPAER